VREEWANETGSKTEVTRFVKGNTGNHAIPSKKKRNTMTSVDGEYIIEKRGLW